MRFSQLEPRHAEVFFEDGLWQIRDISGTSSLRVNGLLTLEAKIDDGSHIKIGALKLTVRTKPEIAPVADQTFIPTGGSLLAVGLVIDGRYQMTVRIISASNAHLLAQWSDAFPTEDALLDAFTSIAPKLARDVERATHRGSGVRRTWALLPGAVALGLGVGAGITLGAAEGRVAMLKSGEPIPGDAKVFAQETKPLQAVGAGLCIAAGATLGVAAALLLFGADSPATPTAFIVPGGGGLALSGVFP